MYFIQTSYNSPCKSIKVEDTKNTLDWKSCIWSSEKKWVIQSVWNSSNCLLKISALESLLRVPSNKQRSSWAVFSPVKGHGGLVFLSPPDLRVKVQFPKHLCSQMRQWLHHGIEASMAGVSILGILPFEVLGQWWCFWDKVHDSTVLSTHLGFQDSWQPFSYDHIPGLVLGKVMVWWVREKEAELCDEILGQISGPSIFCSPPLTMSFCILSPDSSFPRVCSLSSLLFWLYLVFVSFFLFSMIYLGVYFLLWY